LKRGFIEMTTSALAKVSELDRYMAEINKYPLLDAKEETRLARRWIDFGDTSAAHALVTSNLRFVVKIAHEYRGYGMQILDLIQEGSIGLMRGVQRFDPDRGYRLLSYAVFWIRSHIHEFVMGSMRMIKIGTSRAHRKLFFKLRALTGKMAAAGVDDQSRIIDAVAEEVGVEPGEVEEMERHFSLSDASLDKPLAQTGVALVETLPSTAPNQEEILAQIEVEADRAARLESAMSNLDSREKEIIEKRYLWEQPVQLKDIGVQMGVTKQRVSQLESRALRKLKQTLLEAA
jgi:RNA polymerase sigma-32 factor